MVHYVGSWFGSFPPSGRTACGVGVFKTRVDGEADTEINGRVEYVEVWFKVTCRRCLRSVEHKRLSPKQQTLTADKRAGD